VLGIVSLIFWSLIIVISIKYAILIMRADNHGEGGILALLALISPRRAKQSRRRAVMVVIGLIGATLLYGDGAITPAISVLSAIEGIKIYAPQTERVVVPLTVAILVLLFMIQRRGTFWIGGIFGPVMLIWFVVIGAALTNARRVRACSADLNRFASGSASSSDPSQNCWPTGLPSPRRVARPACRYSSRPLR
jgi:KUP system potassium uptake protein